MCMDVKCPHIRKLDKPPASTSLGDSKNVSIWETVCECSEIK